MRTLLSLPLCLLLLLPCQSVAQEDDEEFATRAGLRAHYTTGATEISRVDPDIAFRWDSRPDRRLKDGRFTADWEGRLLVQRSGEHRFHAFVSGRIQVYVNRELVLTGETNKASWVHGNPTSVRFGDHPIHVTYTALGDAVPEVRLFWSSDGFDLEPVPAHLLSPEDSESQPDDAETAEQTLESLRCARCHEDRFAGSAMPAPSLTRIQGAMDYEWMLQKIHKPAATAGSHMPDFGLSREQAGDIVAFLMSQGKAARVSAPPRSRDGDKDRADGIQLIRGLGCLACHQYKGSGTSGPYSGADLTSIGEKRSPAWIHTWLQKPEQLNQDHRMPVFQLSRDERRQIVAALTADATAASDPPPANAARVERGRKLVTEARCANCHQINGLERQPAQTALHSLRADAAMSCLTSGGDHTMPRYPQLDAATGTTIANHARRTTGAGNRESSFDAGRRLLARNNCLSCHERGGSSGLLPVVGDLVRAHRDLRAQSQSLVPPAITAVGDKLTDEALRKAVSGQQKRRLDWLQVRMPQFHHTDEERDQLVAYLIAHDRIPPGSGLEVTVPAPVSADQLVAGQTLVGAGGFSCIACHSAGNYTPRNVALGTRGSDLLMPGDRIRPEFFMRWTRSAIRIVPGTEMPSLTKPVAGVLDEDIHKQLGAIWTALNDPNFTVPTDPGSYEQFLVVRPDEAARIVRDVFTNPVPGEDGYVARTLAVGLNNGHNLLFDLDVFGLRHWWFGEMARQRTEGKSWYWDVAGIGVGRTRGGSDLLLRHDGGELISPTVERATNGRLYRWQQDDAGVLFEYHVNFTVNNEPREVRLTERIHPITTDDATGWTRRLDAGDVPGGTQLLVRLPTGGLADTTNVTGFRSATEHDGERYVVVDDELTLTHLTSLTRPEVKYPPVPPLIAEPEIIDTVPGYDGVRLPISQSIMPTSFATTSDGTLAFTSLKGHVFLTSDRDGDGLLDTLHEFEEGLAAPFGIIADGDDLLVSHKPEVIRLRDTDGDGRADTREVVATGWGYSDNYHDWTCGIVRDSQGNLFVGLGSDYSQPKRPKDRSLWRGAVVRIAPDGTTTPVSHSFRYPVGFIVDDEDRVFVSDNQGVQNTFNEINHVQQGRHYGVASRHEPNPDMPETTPAIRVPHPWTRSVNGLILIPSDMDSPFAGHGIGCEYDTRLLIRFSMQPVGDTVQGATYYFSRPNQGAGGHNFVGPINGTITANGDLYIGSIHDSGWLGGRNTGAIARLRPNGRGPNGIRELRATPDGFEVDFIRPVPAQSASDVSGWSVSGYTRKWEGSYGTPDSQRHDVKVTRVELRPDRRSARLVVERLREEFVYEVTAAFDAGEELFPATGHYTMKRVPTAAAAR